MNRRALLALVHCARKDLGLDEETYRAVLERVAGKRSAAELTDAELGRVVDHMRTRGFAPTASPKRRAAHSDNPHVRKVWAVWNDMGKRGILRDPSRGALRAFVERQTGVTDPEWLNPAQANQVIEALKAWRRREARKP